MKRFVVFTLALLCLSSCGAPKLNPDPSLPSTEANYPTAEFYACGQHFHGLGVCRIDPSAQTSTINLQVQGYFTGSIRVYSVNASDQCNMDETLTYTASSLVSISIPGTVGEGCTIGMLVSPSYPNQNGQDIVVRSFAGFLRVRGESLSNAWNGGVVQFVENADAAFSVPIKASGFTRVVAQGCGLNFDQYLSLSGSSLSLGLKKLGFNPFVQYCVIEGLVNGSPQTYFTEFVNVYAANFVPLSIPALSISNGSLSVTADPTVSVISLDTAYAQAMQYSFKFDATVKHTLRLLTVAGRSVIGDYNPKTKKWTWL